MNTTQVQQLAAMINAIASEIGATGVGVGFIDTNDTCCGREQPVDWNALSPTERLERATIEVLNLAEEGVSDEDYDDLADDLDSLLVVAAADNERVRLSAGLIGELTNVIRTLDTSGLIMKGLEVRLSEFNREISELEGTIRSVFADKPGMVEAIDEVIDDLNA